MSTEDEPPFSDLARPHIATAALPRLSNNSRHALPSLGGLSSKFGPNVPNPKAQGPSHPLPPPARLLHQKPRRRASLLTEGEDGYARQGAGQEEDNASMSSSKSLTSRNSSPALLAKQLGSSPPKALSHLNPVNGSSNASPRPLIGTEELGARPTPRDEWTEAKERARAEAARRRATSGSINPLNREITKQDKEKAIATLARSYLKTWLRAHGALVRPPKMHDNVRRVISAWFDLVDADGGGSLDSSELLTALKAAGIPCDDRTILEMIKLMDLNSDGEISWTEFENFMSNEFASGKTLLSGEYVLPSGTSLPFGAMISTMKRQRMIEDIMEGGERRQKWISLTDNAQAMQEELHLFTNIEASQDEERRKSEKEGRALTALAEMCEREQSAASAAVANAKQSLAAHRMEAGEAGAIIEAAEKRAEAARTEAEAARRAAFESAQERRTQREVQGALSQEVPRVRGGHAPPAAESAFRQALWRMGSSELAAAEAESALKDSAGAELPPPPPQTQAQPTPPLPAALKDTSSTTPAAPPSNSLGSSGTGTHVLAGGSSTAVTLASNSSSSVHSRDNSNSGVDDGRRDGSEPPRDTQAEQVAGGNTEGEVAGGGSAQADEINLLIPIRQLSVVVEADKEGKGDSPLDSPQASHSPLTSHDASRTSSLGPKNKGPTPVKSPPQPERLNTAARAAIRESSSAGQPAATTPSEHKGRPRHPLPPHPPTTRLNHAHSPTFLPHPASPHTPLPPRSPRLKSLSHTHLEPLQQQQARPRDLTPPHAVFERNSPSRNGELLMASARCAAGGDIWSMPNSPAALELALSKGGAGPSHASPLATAKSLPLSPIPPPLSHPNSTPPSRRRPFSRSITAELGSPSTASLAAATAAAIAAETQSGLHASVGGGSPALRMSDSSIPSERSSASGLQPLMPHQRMWKSHGGNKEQQEPRLSNLSSRGSANLGRPPALPHLNQAPTVPPQPHRSSPSPLQSSFPPAAALRPPPACVSSRGLAASLYDPKPPPHPPN